MWLRQRLDRGDAGFRGIRVSLSRSKRCSGAEAFATRLSCRCIERIDHEIAGL